MLLSAPTLLTVFRLAPFRPVAGTITGARRLPAKPPSTEVTRAASLPSAARARGRPRAPTRTGPQHVGEADPAGQRAAVAGAGLRGVAGVGLQAPARDPLRRA